MKQKMSILVILMVTLSSAFPQSGGTFLIEKSVIAGGGGSAAGGTFLLDGTIGQSLAGTSSSGGMFSVGSGFWASSAASIAISGTVTYGNGATHPFVSNVTITGSGSPGVMTTTAPPGGNAGQYMLSGFGAGSYTVTPTKIGGVNGAISSFDAGRIALHVAGPPNPQLNATQLIVADVSGNGAVTSFDAGMIAKFVAGPPYTAPGIGATSTWRFTPVNRAYASVTSNVNGEDYTALLMGEVSGNWTNTGARPVDGPQSDAIGENALPTAGTTGRLTPEIFVDMPKMAIGADKVINIPVSVHGAVKKDINSYEFDLRYDPAVIQPSPDAVNVAGTVSRRLSVVTNGAVPGLLRVVVYGAIPIEGEGVLLNLRFTAIGAPGSVSPLKLERLMFNEGDPGTLVTDGQIQLSAAAAN